MYSKEAKHMYITENITNKNNHSEYSVYYSNALNNCYKLPQLI